MIIYYTDHHDVDENGVTISVHGARYNYEDKTGIVCRDLYNAHTDTYVSVASRYVDISRLNINYTDGHDVDEDTRTVINGGGDFRYDNSVGVTFRDMFSTSTRVWETIASKHK